MQLLDVGFHLRWPLVKLAGCLLLWLPTSQCAAAAGPKISDLFMSSDESEQETDHEDGAQLANEPTVDELLSLGIQRLQENKTWKLWKWPLAAKEFVDAKEFM